MNDTTQMPVVQPSSEAMAVGIAERALTNLELPMERIEKAFELRRQMKAEYAETAFKRALAEMQPELPTIDKNGVIEVRAKDAKGERTGNITQSTAFADWADINDAIKPLMGKYGFSFMFLPANAADGRITIKCILAHRDGHEVSADFTAAYDVTGSKNNIQGAGSTISYLKRYLGCALLNITSRAPIDRDKDGSDPITVITDEQVKALEESLQKFAPQAELAKERLCAALKIKSLAEMPAAKLEQATQLLQKKAAQKVAQ